MEKLIASVNHHILKTIQPRMRASPTLKDVIVWAEAFQPSSGTLSLGLALGQGTGCSPFCGCAAKQIAELVGDELKGVFPEIKRATGMAALPAPEVLKAWGKEAAANASSSHPIKIPDTASDSPTERPDPATRVFKLRLSERCYRFKPDAVAAHAPLIAGLYEFVAFDEKVNPSILFVGLSSPRSIAEALQAHLEGRLEPTFEVLRNHAKDVYFDYVEDSDAQSPQDFQDLAAALIERHKPPFNSTPSHKTGRFSRIEIQEL